MPKTRTTVTLDDDVLRAVKVRAARTGRGDSEVIEESVRRHLGFDLLDRLWARNSLSEPEALEPRGRGPARDPPPQALTGACRSRSQLRACRPTPRAVAGNL